MDAQTRKDVELVLQAIDLATGVFGALAAAVNREGLATPAEFEAALDRLQGVV